MFDLFLLNAFLIGIGFVGWWVGVIVLSLSLSY